MDLLGVTALGLFWRGETGDSSMGGGTFFKVGGPSGLQKL